ncbi:MAG: quinoprotein dehydrogenase-associated putative ABC transporter substrate-binding protein [Opitutus sp.]|nr:quinoprotein dehydrogenase-associated putative ABC transporter substrate-binding protein [Opitutus sp.]
MLAVLRNPQRNGREIAACDMGKRDEQAWPAGASSPSADRRSGFRLRRSRWRPGGRGVKWTVLWGLDPRAGKSEVRYALAMTLCSGALGLGRIGGGFGGWVLTATFAAVAAMATPAERVLRVAADPDNLPFSNAQGEGFENELAELLARELRARLDYVWRTPRQGGLCAALRSGEADVVIGIPLGGGALATTRPYYASTYVFVYRRDAMSVSSFDDPVLRVLRVGVQMTGRDLGDALPVHALIARGVLENIRGYACWDEASGAMASSEIIRAVASREIDVAVAWGPVASYHGARQSVPLELVPVSPERDGPNLPFVFRIGVGVRKADGSLRREIDQVLLRCQREIASILEKAGVPCVPAEVPALSFLSPHAPL